ncbi:3403_t:CDS:2, partial [Gigaspora rosea]
ICSLETRLKELLSCNRLSSEQVKIGDRDIQESLTQQTLTSLNRQTRSSISPKINPESSSYIISEIKNNNIPIKEIEALPV